MNEDEPSVEALLHSLRSHDRHEKSVAAIRLGQVGAMRSLSQIEILASDSDALVAISAGYAWWQLTGEVRGIDRLIAGLASDDEETMQLAVMALGEMGEDAVEGLTAALNAGSPHSSQIRRILHELDAT